MPVGHRPERKRKGRDAGLYSKSHGRRAIGGIPLSLGLACGDMVLTVAVLAIVLTAPLGAFCH